MAKVKKLTFLYEIRLVNVNKVIIIKTKYNLEYKVNNLETIGEHKIGLITITL